MFSELQSADPSHKLPRDPGRLVRAEPIAASGQPLRGALCAGWQHLVVSFFLLSFLEAVFLHDGYFDLFLTKPSKLKLK